jgi:hypothetical protein
MEEWASRAGISYETLWRVTSGKGSVKATKALRDVLIAAGQKVPPISFGDEPVKARSKLDEWVELGAQLSELSPEGYESTLAKIREVVRAHQIVKGGLTLSSDAAKPRTRARSGDEPGDVNDDE